jgi:limonene-1,2-epoxide hydrolase
MSPIRMSKLENAIRTVLAFNEARNRHDLAAMVALMSHECIFENAHPAPDGTVISGVEAVATFWQDFFRESHGAHFKIEEIFGLGERCILRWKYHRDGTDGNEGDLRGVDLFRVRDGTISEQLSYVKG